MNGSISVASAAPATQPSVQIWQENHVSTNDNGDDVENQPPSSVKVNRGGARAALFQQEGQVSKRGVLQVALDVPVEDTDELFDFMRCVV
jgi:hypothetical protein